MLKLRELSLFPKFYSVIMLWVLEPNVGKSTFFHNTAIHFLSLLLFAHVKCDSHTVLNFLKDNIIKEDTF